MFPRDAAASQFRDLFQYHAACSAVRLVCRVGQSKAARQTSRCHGTHQRKSCARARIKNPRRRYDGEQHGHHVTGAG